MQHLNHFFQRALYGAGIILALGLTGCSNDNPAPLSSTTPTTLPLRQANLILGQVGIDKKAANLVDAAGISSPGGIAVDSVNDRLYIADTNNSRVLAFNNLSALTTGTAADIVIGQADIYSSICNRDSAAGANTLCGPKSIAVDSSGNLYVADTQNNRVLVYDGTMIATGMNATIVLGQLDFNTNTNNAGGIGPKSLSSPAGVGVDSSGNLYVADTGNNRILEYTASFVSNAAAARVFGQGADMDSRLCNAGGITAISLCSPTGLLLDTGSLPNRLYIIDTGNHRVLAYDTPLATVVADHVFGQATFSTNSAGAGLGALNTPMGAALDSSGNLFITDGGNHRALEFATPYVVTGVPGSGDATADLVFGGGVSVVLSGTATSATPTTLADSAAAFVANAYQNLVVVITGGTGVGQSRTIVSNTGPPTRTLTVSPTWTITPDATSTYQIVAGFSPAGIASDGSDNLYIADTVNNQILEYITPLSGSAPGPGDIIADVVLGQGSGVSAFTRNVANFVDAAGLNALTGIAMDRSVSPNMLYIADTQNNRVLGYIDVTALTTGVPADIVIGQANMNANLCNQGTTASATSLCGPRGVAVDSTGNLYVADTNNNRVLEYDAPVTNGATANRVFGQGFSVSVSGTATGGTSTTLSDTTQTFTVNQFINFLVVITGGTGQGQSRTIATNTATQLTVSTAWTLAPDATSAYQIMAGFNTAICNNAAVLVGGLGAKSLCSPVGVALDSNDNLYIADTNNHRVLEYDTPLSDATADFVLGQLALNTSPSYCNSTAIPNADPSEGTLCSPQGIALDSNDNLYVADKDNNRVLEYDSPLTQNTTADFVFGQENFISKIASPASASSLYFPAAVALDGSDNLYVADSYNNRVLEYEAPLSNDSVADDVFGQAGFEAASCNSVSVGGLNDSSLCGPLGVAVDNNGNLYVGDTNNNRVLRFGP